MGVQLKTLVTRPVPLVDGNTAPAGQLTHDNVRGSGGVSGSEALTLNERLDPSIAILPVGAVRLGEVSWATGGFSGWDLRELSHVSIAPQDVPSPAPHPSHPPFCEYIRLGKHLMKSSGVFYELA